MHFRFLVLLFFLLPRAVHAKWARTNDPMTSFLASGPAGMKIRGVTHVMSISDDDRRLIVTVPLATFETGIALRDKHLRERCLDTAHFPTADLLIDRAQIQIPHDDGDHRAEASAVLRLHGRERPVVVRYSIRRKGAVHSVAAAFHIDVRDYGIEAPHYLGISVKPDVDIEANFDAVDQ